MRIHSDILTNADIDKAMTATGMANVNGQVSIHGSRSRAQAFNVLLTGNSTHRPNSGKAGAQNDDYAATWDEWGIFLNALYAIDPNLVTPYYADANDFHRKTVNRFTTLQWAEQCRSHKWVYDFSLGGHTCKKCHASQVR